MIEYGKDRRGRTILALPRRAAPTPDLAAHPTGAMFQDFITKAIQGVADYTRPPLAAGEPDGGAGTLPPPSTGGQMTDANENDFLKALANAENSVKAGFSEGRWRPHTSLEGGTSTLAYGHKLTAQEEAAGAVSVDGQTISLEDGLTEEQAQALLKQDLASHSEGTRAALEAVKPGLWEKLPQKYRSVIENIAFNVGSFNPKGWPKLLAAMEAGDDATVRKEMVTTYQTPEGERKQLTSRAQAIADAVGLA